MIKDYFFRLPTDSEDVIHTFNLKKVLENPRTAIYQNENMRFSFDKTVVRVLLYDDNAELLEQIYSYFYGEEYEKLRRVKK